jgi:hypothetical protein
MKILNGVVLGAGILKLCFVLALLVPFILPSEVWAHQAFNSQEETIGNYRIALSTDPEIPMPGKPTKLRIDVTDPDYNTLVDVRAGVRVFKNDVLVHEVQPHMYSIGDFEIEYTFPDPGMYMVEVYVLNPPDDEVSAEFNVGILQAFGYIFYSVVIFALAFPLTILGIIFFVKRRKAKQLGR